MSRQCGCAEAAGAGDRLGGVGGPGRRLWRWFKTGRSAISGHHATATGDVALGRHVHHGPANLDGASACARTGDRGVGPSVTRPTTMRLACAAGTTWDSTAADFTLTDSGLTSQGLVFESLTVQSPEAGREGADPSKGGQT